MSGFIDDEKIPTSPADFVVTRGVRVHSRYQKQHEIKLMVRAVGLMPATMCAAIYELWCDSKACDCFIVNLWPAHNSPAAAKEIATWLHEYMLAHNKGHNGIYVGDPGEVVHPDWVID